MLFWAIFCPLTLLTTQKIKVLKKWKKHLEILSFCTHVPQKIIIWCMVPKIFSATDRLFCHFGLFFALLPPLQPGKSKFWKNENNSWRYYHFAHEHPKWKSHVWFLRYGAQQTEFFLILDQFLPFYPPFLPPNNPENQNFEKMKKTCVPYKCAINDTGNELLLHTSQIVIHILLTGKWFCKIS